MGDGWKRGEYEAASRSPGDDGWRTGLAMEGACWRGASGFGGWLQASVGGPRLERASQIGRGTWLIWIPACNPPKGNDCLQRLLGRGPVSGSDSEEKQMPASRWKSPVLLASRPEPGLEAWQDRGSALSPLVPAAAAATQCCGEPADLSSVAECDCCTEKPKQRSSKAMTPATHKRQRKLDAGVLLRSRRMAAMGFRKISALESQSR